MFHLNNRHKQRGALAIGTAVILSGVLVTISLMNQQQAENTSLSLHAEAIKNVLANATKDAARELGVFIPNGLIQYDGSKLNLNTTNSAPMQWKNAGSNVKKIGCIKPLAENQTCSPEDEFEIIARVTGSPTAPDDSGTNNIDYLKIHLHASIEKAIHGGAIERDLSVYVKRSVLPTTSTPTTPTSCAYLDPAVPFVPTYFYMLGGRYTFIGWAKIKPPTNFAAAPGFPVASSEWRQTNHYSPDHNWKSFPRGATVDVRNYYMRINGWASWASLIIPKAKPGECLMHFQGFRRNAYNLGCFVEGTEIATSAASATPIELLKKGDQVYNPKSGKLQTIKRVIAGPEEESSLVEFHFDNQILTVTVDHPMHTNRGLIQAGEMQLGDQIMNARGEWITPMIKLIPSEDRVVYNLELEGDGSVNEHMVAANSIITGDLYLQEKLIADKKSPDVAEQKQSKGLFDYIASLWQ